MNEKSRDPALKPGPLPVCLQAWLLALLLCLAVGPDALASDREAKRILVYGDSLSAAYRMDETEGWVALLSQQMQTGALPHEVINASVSGETTSGGLARLPATLAQHQPDIVILELGGNDGLRGLPIGSIRENLLAMIDMAEESGAEVILAGIQIPPNYGPRYTGPFTRLYPGIAEERGLRLIPFLIEGIPEQPELMQDDGIHPVAEAQPLIVDNVWRILSQTLSSSSAGSD